ncbi:MAG: chemotaxis protein CheW [Candidatus Omnitrophica bacterium]|nr:chemotaxis protein CheW [Candidatus Omnitrophota bacterium]
MPEDEFQMAGGEATASDVIQLVCFKLANEEYAIDINLVQEVIKVSKITPVPQMPDFCLGVINSRGNVIPVFDLRKKFHLEEKDFDEDTRILVAAINNVIVSMVVDEVLDNIKFDSTNIDPAPAVKMSIDREYVLGLGEMENRMIVILDLPRMHDFIKQEIGV